MEDNLINQKVFSQQLRKAGCVVHLANHGVEALQFLENTTFQTRVDKQTAIPLSIVLMDLEMPVMDGLTCVKEIRRLQEEGQLRQNLPVFAVTGKRARHGKSTSFNLKVQSCISVHYNPAIFSY